jgi:hypothetical protein
VPKGDCGHYICTHLGNAALGLLGIATRRGPQLSGGITMIRETGRFLTVDRVGEQVEVFEYTELIEGLEAISIFLTLAGQHLNRLSDTVYQVRLTGQFLTKVT